MNEKIAFQIIELPRYLDIPGVCKHFSVGPESVIDALRCGELKGSKLGRQIKDPVTKKVIKTIRGKKWTVETVEVVKWFKRWTVPIKSEEKSNENNSRALPGNSSLHLA